MRLIRRGGTHALPIEATCTGCKSVFSVEQADWKDGEYGGEKIVKCTVCGYSIVKPGTEYRGDF